MFELKPDFSLTQRRSEAEIREILRVNTEFIGQAIAARARDLAPKDTGRLANAIAVNFVHLTGNNYRTEIFVDTRFAPYGIWVSSGTGVHGRYRRPYTTKYARTVRRHLKRASPKLQFMVFTYQGRKFRLKEVKGQRPNPFMTRAYQEAKFAEIPFTLKNLKESLVIEVKSQFHRIQYKKF